MLAATTCLNASSTAMEDTSVTALNYTISHLPTQLPYSQNVANSTQIATSGMNRFQPHLPWANATQTAGPTGTAQAQATVIVGSGGKLVFAPSSLNVSVGTTVTFDFLGLNHTLTQSDLATPCQYNGNFDSGFRQFNPTNVSGKFLIKYHVTDAQPKWFFCAQELNGSHCHAGMVFSLNPDGAQSTYLSNALSTVETQATSATCPVSAVHTSPNSTTTAKATPTSTTVSFGVTSATILPSIVGSGGMRNVAGLAFLLAFVL